MDGGYRASDAHKMLSELIKQKLDVEIPPDQLRLFIKVYWARISLLAHNIHATDEKNHERQTHHR